MSISNYQQNILLDINSNQAYTVINAKQGDQNTRQLNITFTEDGVTRALSSGTELVFRLRKPDGTAVILTEGTDTNNISRSGNIAQVTLSGQCLAAAGRGYADILEQVGSGDSRQIISAASFILNIMSAPNVLTNLKSDNQYAKLFDAVDAAIASASYAAASASSAGISANSAAISAAQAITSAATARNSAATAISSAAMASNSAAQAINALSSLASPFSNNTSYSKGEYVLYSGSIYRFTTNHSAGAWNSSQVTQIVVMNEIYNHAAFPSLISDDDYVIVFSYAGGN